MQVKWLCCLLSVTLAIWRVQGCPHSPARVSFAPLWACTCKQTFPWLNDAAISFSVLRSGLGSTVIAPLYPALQAVWIPSSTWWDDLLQCFMACVSLTTNGGSLDITQGCSLCEVSWRSWMSYVRFAAVWPHLCSRSSAQNRDWNCFTVILVITPNICINSKPLYFHLLIISAYIYLIILGCYQDFRGAAYVGFFELYVAIVTTVLYNRFRILNKYNCFNYCEIDRWSWKPKAPFMGF